MLRKKLNLIGTRFGNGTVISEINSEIVGKGKYPREYQRWYLRCDCGNEYISSSRYLLFGKGTHCGCKRKQNLLGMIFGKSKVIRFVGSKMRGKLSPRPANIWELQCECGNYFQTSSENLLSGCTHSCGCQRSMFHKSFAKKSFAQFWKALNASSKRRNRKVFVTQEQLLLMLVKQNNKCSLSGLPISFEDGSASLDRIDNNGDYTIDNIQWVHRKINYMKNILEQDEFVTLCGLVTQQRNNHFNFPSI